MKKIIFWLIGIVAVCFMLGVSADYEKCYVTADILNCRKNPTTKSSVVTTYKKGAELSIIGADGIWWQVYDGQNQGWCHSAYLKTEEQKAQEDLGGEIGECLGSFKITYYTCSKKENGGYDVTAKGQKLLDVVDICIAADPRVIPYYTKVYIEGVGFRTVLDCGGKIKGNRIDVLVKDKSSIPSIGTHYADVYLVK